MSKRAAPARWWRWVGIWTVVGLAVRLAAVLGRPHAAPLGDAYYYHYAANLLAAGKGFINPVQYFGPHHQVIPGADFPPGFVWVLAFASAIGLKSFFAQRIWCCVLGSTGIVLGALVGRQIGGDRPGLIAAALIALYPNVWMNDELGLSEALSPVVVLLVVLVAYRFWRHPNWRRAAELGLALGAAILVRDELALLGLFCVVPLILLTRSRSLATRIGLVAAATATSLLVVAPWVGYNLSRFQKPVFISTGFGITLASANCDTTFSGPVEGYWSFSCALAAPVSSNADESVQGSEAQAYAMHFIRAHQDRLLPVEAARLGRAFGLFHPVQQIHLDSQLENRPYHWALAGLGAYYLLLVGATAGLVMLRRQRIPVMPLVSVGLVVVVSVLLTFGQTRYRSTFEMSLVLLSSVPVARIWNRVRPPESDGEAPGSCLTDEEVATEWIPAG